MKGNTVKNCKAKVKANYNTMKGAFTIPKKGSMRSMKKRIKMQIKKMEKIRVKTLITKKIKE